MADWTGSDQSEALIDAVLRAREEAGPMVIAGAGSKSLLAGTAESSVDARLISTLEHRGIIEYRPDELVITARSGTTLKELNQALAREGQMLPFEPPELRGLGTLGGAVAAGLSGPGRPWRGAVRDSVLGVVMINGLGERLTFGGQVMKNVAGFDVSRLQAGAWGTLGLLLEISVRVLPNPAHEQTRLLEITDANHALDLMRGWAAQPLPVTATCYQDNQLHVRLSGAESAVQVAALAIGGETEVDDGYWSALRDHRLPWFRNLEPGLRQPPPATPARDDEALIEWSGARRWLRTPADTVSQDSVDPSGGDALFGSGFAHRICTLADGQTVLAGYQQRLKVAFDPDNLFNPEICRADQPA